ncbi:MAG: hypothetical protein EAZ42_05170 [Verrucomicrobia bacterium]|nr:MAG: hypothetical protein EAZ42_05170 [Verrucomicrobiota bacterium]
MKKIIFTIFYIVLYWNASAQNFTFDYNNNGKRVCLVSSEINAANNQVKILFLDHLSNTSDPTFVSRRALGATAWTPVANALPPGTPHWTDTNVTPGEIWEYQIKRKNTTIFNNVTYDATGYTIGSLLSDNTHYKGQMVLLVANDIPANLSAKYTRLKKEIVADGWLVNELIVPRATSWDSGNAVVAIKNSIVNIYNAAPTTDKPKILFILGHVPLPRSGSTSIMAPDEHDENKGARGADSYYADIDGVYTDIATYNPGGLQTSFAINLPGDFKWDQDIFPSDIEMAFGRIDFADITEVAASEFVMLERYLDRLSKYRNVAPGHDMGEKTGFNFGYDNSNDGTYRSLPNISKPSQVFQRTTTEGISEGWVRENGPFKFFMQNIIGPEIQHWEEQGMDATVYSSDQSYWGFGDVPQSVPSDGYSRIRAILGVESKCLILLWTTSGINIFHQAGVGQPLGLAMKTIMNHNSSNQYLEKPPQQYDTEEWWNRTHFAFYGDPTINLYQIRPASNITMTRVGSNVQINWSSSPDPSVLGYHIYESTSEFGRFNRVSTSVVSGNSFVLNSYNFGNWYMVKAVKVIESGCGKFLHPSLGIAMQGNILSSSSDLVAFRSTHMLAADGSDDAATPASDSVPNLLKYAFNMIGSGPSQSSSITTPNSTQLIPGGVVGLPLISLDSTGHLKVELVRRKASSNPGINYVVQFSSTLENGSWLENAGATTTISSINSTWERVVVQDSAVFTRRFARVAVQVNQ